MLVRECVCVRERECVRGVCGGVGVVLVLVLVSGVGIVVCGGAMWVLCGE